MWRVRKMKRTFDTHCACFTLFAESIAPGKTEIMNASCSHYTQHAAQGKSRFQNTPDTRHDTPHDRKLHERNI